MVSLPDRIGINAEGSATNAARLRAAADAAALHIGRTAAVRGTDHNELQTVQKVSRASNAPFAVGTESLNENRIRTVIAFEQQGPSSLFMAQHIAQEAGVTGGVAVTHLRATDAYRSLAAEPDPVLPAWDIAFLTDAPRIDRHI